MPCGSPVVVGQAPTVSPERKLPCEALRSFVWTDRKYLVFPGEAHSTVAEVWECGEGCS